MTASHGLFAVGLGLGLLCLATPSRACWDGYRAQASHLTLAEYEGPDEAGIRRIGTWMTRIDALLAEHDTLEATWGYATLDDRQLKYEAGDLEALFEAVASAVAASPAHRAAARRSRVTVLTIQTFAGRTEASARAAAARVDVTEAAEYGFIEVGGFPSLNPKARVVVEADARGRRLFKVHAGAFLDATEARRVAIALEAETGKKTWIRPL